MTVHQHNLEPGERFPKDMQAPALSDILTELSKFGIDGAAAIELIDSTHDAADVRLTAKCQKMQSGDQMIIMFHEVDSEKAPKPKEEYITFS